MHLPNRVLMKKVQVDEIKDPIQRQHLLEDVITMSKQTNLRYKVEVEQAQL